MDSGVPVFFGEKNPNARRFTSAFSILLAMLTLKLSVEFSLINIRIFFAAGLVSIVPRCSR